MSPCLLIIDGSVEFHSLLLVSKVISKETMIDGIGGTHDRWEGMIVMAGTVVFQ